MTAWLDGLADDEFGHVERYIDLLANQGTLLASRSPDNLTGNSERPLYLGNNRPASPTTSPPDGTSCCTVFAKTRPRERTEIDRARRAMQRCIDEGHIAIEEGFTMNRRTTWDEMKARRADSSQRRRG